MKSRIIIWIGLMVLLSNCQNKAIENEESGFMIIGKIDGDARPLFYENLHKQELVTLNDKGEFKVYIASKNPVIIPFRYGFEQKFDIYGEPGDTVSFSLDGFEFQNFGRGIKFDGDKAIENEILQKQKEVFQVNSALDLPFFNCEETEIVSKIDSLQKESKANIDQFESNYKDLNPQFLNMLRNHINYEYASYLADYYFIRKYNFAGELGEQTLEEFSDYDEALYVYFDEDPSLLAINSYRKYVRLLLKGQIDRIISGHTEDTFRSDEFIPTGIKLIESNFHDPAIKEYLHFWIINKYSKENWYTGVDQYIEEFLQETTNEEYKNRLNQISEKFGHLKKGLNAPNLSFKDVDGEVYHLADFKGQMLYIHVWATWCGICRFEDQKLTKVIDQFENQKGIKFLKVSIDKNETKWREAVTKEDLEILQLLSDKDKEGNSLIQEAFLIAGIPRFILIDKEGKIIDPEAPRASHDHLVPLLEDLMALN